MRLETKETNQFMTDSSVARLATFNKHKPPKDEADLKNMLSDRTHETHQVFRDQKSDFVLTICVGEFPNPLKNIYCWLNYHFFKRYFQLDCENLVHLFRQSERKRPDSDLTSSTQAVFFTRKIKYPKLL